MAVWPSLLVGLAGSPSRPGRARQPGVPARQSRNQMGGKDSGFRNPFAKFAQESKLSNVCNTVRGRPGGNGCVRIVRASPHPISCLRHEMSLSPKGRGETACGGLAKCVSHPTFFSRASFSCRSPWRRLYSPCQLLRSLLSGDRLLGLDSVGHAVPSPTFVVAFHHGPALALDPVHGLQHVPDSAMILRNNDRAGCPCRRTVSSS
jgi:hypothetical protein